MVKKKKTNFFVKTKSFNNLSFPILFLLSFFLIFFNKADYYLIYKLKSFSIDVITPVSKIVTSPISYTVNTINSINALRNIQSENIRLKEEIVRLKKWQTLALNNLTENTAYKKLLNSTSNEMNLIKTASIKIQASNIYSNTAIINAGIEDKIKKDYPVINERGLIGKILSVTDKNSKVLLINNQNSSVPVKILNKDFYAVVKGASNGKHLVSSFIKDDTKAKVGDVLITSGNGNIYPMNILVGKIIGIKNEKIVALPYADLYNLKYVQILNNK